MSRGGFICTRLDDTFTCRGRFREDGIFLNCNVRFTTSVDVPVNVDKTDEKGTRHWYGDNEERVQLFAEFLKANSISRDAVVVVDGIER
jgi:hypothetical protein